MTRAQKTIVASGTAIFRNQAQGPEGEWPAACLPTGSAGRRRAGPASCLGPIFALAARVVSMNFMVVGMDLMVVKIIGGAAR